MRLLLLILITTIVSLTYGEEKEKQTTKDNPLAHGFSNEIDWVEWEQAIGVAKDLNKPIFFLIHKTWCGACRGLKKEFSTSHKTPELIELSKKFVMVNVEDDDEPEDDKYAPDGGYIPRILFLDTDAEPLQTNNEKRYKNNKYFYPLVPEIIDGMKRALDEFNALKKDGSAKPSTKKTDTEEKKEKSEKNTKASNEKNEKEQKEVKEKKNNKESKTESNTKEKKTEKKTESKTKKEEKKTVPKKEDEKKETKKKGGKEEKKTEKTKESSKKQTKQEKTEEKSKGKEDKKSKTDKDTKKKNEGKKEEL